MWKRLTLSLVAVAALSALVMGASFALFTASTTNSSNTFTAGTVAINATWTTTVTIAHMVPGDNGDYNYAINYTGNVPAWIGLDTTLGGTLVNCDPGPTAAPNAHKGLEVTVDNGASPLVTYDSNKSNQLMNGTTPSASGATLPIHVHYSLDSSVGNGCQGQSATFTLSAHAVQAGNNPLATSGTNIGQPSWS